MKQALVKFLSNDIVERALKTFVQAFIAALLVSHFQLDTTTITAAAAAGLSAAWNYLKTT